MASGDGMSWSEAFKNIQEGIDAASEGDMIWVKAGTYSPPSRINMSKSVHMFGGFSGLESELNERNWKINKTIVDGQNNIQCIYIRPGGTLDGFTIQNGQGEQGGGIEIFRGYESSDVTN